MAGRLPLLYREGELTGAVLGVPGLALDIADEDLVSIQRSHWFDRCVDRDDAAGLAAVLDLAPEEWQSLGLFRAWVHALRDALLLEGAVTRAALARFVRAYATSFQAAMGILALPPLGEFASAPDDARVAIVENPPRRRGVRAPAAGGGVEPLHRFDAAQGGLDPVPAAFLLTGLPEGPECVPLIANLTTREALLFHGTVATGERLWIVPQPDGGVRAQLEQHDVSERLVSIGELQPGQPWEEAQVRSPARAITLRPGQNELWFLPVAHYDEPGLDRFLLALADLELREGRWDETGFDHALFYLDPAVNLHAAWTEAEPAAFEVDLPAGTLRHAQGAEADARASRDRLAASLEETMTRLRAAGVRGAVRLRPFAEVQRLGDHLLARQPMVQREVGPTGADALPDAGGLFGKTPFDNSTYR
jgi:hypothetical protein